MKPDEMKARTRAFALRVIRLAESFPKTPTANVIRNQMLRSGPSVGSNYRAACRAKSKPDFVSKMGIVEEEADESAYWMELLIESGLLTEAQLSELLKETKEIIAMTVASIRTLQKRDGSSPFNRQSKIENLK